MIAYIINLLLVMICLVFSLTISIKFRKSKQIASWLTISFSFGVYLVYLLFKILNYEISYLFILFLFFLEAGVLSYWLIIAKTINRCFPSKEIGLISLFIALFYFTSILYSSTITIYIDAIKMILIFALLLTSLPLVVMFRKGMLGVQWLLFLIGTSILLIGEFINMIGINLDLLFLSLSNIFYIISFSILGY